MTTRRKVEQLSLLTGSSITDKNNYVNSSIFDRVIDKIAPEHGYEFDAKVFHDLCRPIVYLFVGDHDKVLYVGMSKNGITRPADAEHCAAYARAKCRKIWIYPCTTPFQAEALESYLIVKFRPQFNKRCNPGRRKYFQSAASMIEAVEKYVN